MRVFIFLLALVVAGCAPPDPPDLDGASQSIINGTREPQQTQMSAGQKMSLGFLHDAGSPSSYFCSATLIAPRVVITAAHCTRRSARSVGFGVGVDPGNPSASFQAAEVHNHPVHDISILILTEDVTARLPAIEPLPWNDAAIGGNYVGEWIEVCGYGDTYDNSKRGRWCGVSQILNLDDDAIVVNGHGQQGICFGDSGGGSLMMFDGQVRVMAVVSEGEQDYCLGGREWLVRTEFVGDWVRGLAGEPQQSDPCRGIDALGVCEGSVVRRCTDGVFEERDCGALGTGCGYVDGVTGYGCDCTGIPAAGTCDGDLRTFCDAGAWAQERCAADLSCDFAEDAAAFVCADFSSPQEPGPDPDHEGPDDPSDGPGDEPSLDAPGSDGAWVDDQAGNAWADGPGGQSSAPGAEACSAAPGATRTLWMLRRR
jgi:hypothetical protein